MSAGSTWTAARSCAPRAPIRPNAGNAAELRLRAGGARHRRLVAIGGDDTAFSLYRVAKYAQEKMGITLQSLHVPKTIDNDLPLPEGIPTFGLRDGARGRHALVRTSWRMRRPAALVFRGDDGAQGRPPGAGHRQELGRHPDHDPRRMARPRNPAAGSRGHPGDLDPRRLADGKNYGVALIAEGVMEYTSDEDLQAWTR